jgi:hypothetical protein
MVERTKTRRSIAPSGIAARMVVFAATAAATVVRCALAFVVVVGLGVVAGCDRNGSEPGPTATAPTPPSLGTTSADARTAALEAYRGMWRAWVDAGTTSDPTHPDLARYASEQALQSIVRALAINRDKGWVSKGEPVIAPRVESASPPTNPAMVRIRDCIDTSNWLNYKASGELADDTPGGKRLVVADVKPSSGVWKVAGFGITAVQSC